MLTEMRKVCKRNEVRLDHMKGSKVYVILHCFPGDGAWGDFWKWANDNTEYWFDNMSLDVANTFQGEAEGLRFCLLKCNSHEVKYHDHSFFLKILPHYYLKGHVVI